MAGSEVRGRRAGRFSGDWLAAGLAVGLAGNAGAIVQTFEIPVTQMGEYVVSGSIDLQTDSTADVRFGGGDESRAVMEFLLPGLPTGTLLDAELSYFIASLQGNAGTTPSLQFHAYAGDGVATSSDTSVFNVVGTTGPLNSGSQTLSLDLPAIEAVLSSDPAALGLMAWSQFPDNLRAGIVWNGFGGSEQPSLSLTYEIDRLGSVSSTPIAEAQATKTSGVWSVTPDPNDVYVSKTLFNNGEERAIFEFNAPPVPDGAIVTGGTLSLDIRTFSSSTITDDLASVFAHLYAGDGVAELTDVGALSFPFAQSVRIDQGGVLDIELDRRALQAAYDQGVDVLGTLLSYAEDNTLNANFYTATGAAGSSFLEAPQLSVDYAILDGALAGDADLDDDIDLADALILVNAYTGSLAGDGDAIWLDGDFDGDGDVDFADAMALRNNFAGDVASLDAAFRQIPEPVAAAGMLVMLGVLRRRR
ncbi:MAG: hypothetical protein AAGE65_08810 [Planctomycetota bacterium]